jgi:hypothetical protein
MAENPVQRFAAFARRSQTTQVFISARGRELHSLVRLLPDMQATIVSERIR